MRIHFKCQQCGVKVNVPATAAGMNSKCPQCGGITVVPQPIEQSKPDHTEVSGHSPNAAAGHNSDKLASPAKGGSEAKPSEPERIPCPYCAEPILPNSRKCRFCGEFFKSIAACETIERTSTEEPNKSLVTNTLSTTGQQKAAPTDDRWNFDFSSREFPWYRIAATLVIAAVKAKVQAETPGGSPEPIVWAITFAVILVVCYLAVRWGLYSTSRFTLFSAVSWGVIFFLASRLLAPIDYAFVIAWCAFRDEPENSAYDWPALQRWLFLAACLLACFVGAAINSELRRSSLPRSSSGLMGVPPTPSYVAFSLAQCPAGS